MRLSLPLAPALDLELLSEGVQAAVQINLEEVRSGFVASGNDLFSFVTRYPYEQEIPFDEKVTIFCQLISLYENEFLITEQFEVIQEVEYALVYPK